MPVPEVFLSYSHEHTDFAKPLVSLVRTLLRLGRMCVFHDATSIQPGDEWEKVLRESLRRSKMVVILWCIHAKNSEWVSKEMAIAADLKTPCVPVILDRTPLPAYVARFHWIDGRELIPHETTEISATADVRKKKKGRKTKGKKTPDRTRLQVDLLEDRLSPSAIQIPGNSSGTYYLLPIDANPISFDSSFTPAGTSTFMIHPWTTDDVLVGDIDSVSSIAPPNQYEFNIHAGPCPPFSCSVVIIDYRTRDWTTLVDTGIYSHTGWIALDFGGSSSTIAYLAYSLVDPPLPPLLNDLAQKLADRISSML